MTMITNRVIARRTFVTPHGIVIVREYEPFRLKKFRHGTVIAQVKPKAIQVELPATVNGETFQRMKADYEVFRLACEGKGLFPCVRE